jgi:hypothetical protein
MPATALYSKFQAVILSALFAEKMPYCPGFSHGIFFEKPFVVK